VFGLTFAFYPDAWLALGGRKEGHPPECIQETLSLLQTGSLPQAWPAFWESMSLTWANHRNSTPISDWVGSPFIEDWTHQLFKKLAQSQKGRSLRAAQRRLQRWIGLNRTSLEFHKKLEEVHSLSVSQPSASAAEISIDAGFSDQSHMGRALKRATGFSTKDLNDKVMNEEAFWCYRLLGERF